MQQSLLINRLLIQGKNCAFNRVDVDYYIQENKLTLIKLSKKPLTSESA